MELRNAGIKPVIKPQHAKLAPDECNFLVLPPPAMPPALAAKTIDAYCVAEPFNALGELKAGGKLLRFTGDIWKGHPCCVVVMHEADAMDPARAQWAQAVLNAIVQAQIYINAEQKRSRAHAVEGRQALSAVPGRSHRARDDLLQSGALSRKRSSIRIGSRTAST